MKSLVAQVGTVEAIKVRHSGDVTSKVIEGTHTVLKEADRTLAAPQDWSGITLNSAEKTILAGATHQLRFADDRAYLLQTHEMLFDAHWHGLRVLGGVPERGLYCKLLVNG
jgi:hypothetical protein